MTAATITATEQAFQTRRRGRFLSGYGLGGVRVVCVLVSAIVPREIWRPTL